MFNWNWRVLVLILVTVATHAAVHGDSFTRLKHESELNTPILSVKGDTVFYSGSLTKQGINNFAKLLAEHSDIHWLVINSVGGEINNGMDMGDLVYSHKLNVRVTFICASSCANYVFTAADIKIIDKGAIVGWHGSAIQSGLASQMSKKQIVRQLKSNQEYSMLTPEQQNKAIANIQAKFKQYIAKAIARQTAFFHKIHVNEDITVVGLNVAHGLYCMSVSDMAKFGVHDVTASPDYPRDSLPRFKNSHDPIYLFDPGTNHVVDAR